MSWFPLVFDRSGRTPLAREEFPAEQRARALSEREQLIERHIHDREVEVVLLGARTLEEVRATHGRYFQGVFSPSRGRDAARP